MNFDENPEPKSDFPYHIVTEKMMEHSKGIAWTASLYREGLKIGSVEQEGNGGADSVIIESAADRATWTVDVQEAFDGDEEQASFYLLIQEEERLTKGF
jgi:hypothetical protein